MPQGAGFAWSSTLPPEHHTLRVRLVTLITIMLMLLVAFNLLVAFTCWSHDAGRIQTREPMSAFSSSTLTHSDCGLTGVAADGGDTERAEALASLVSMARSCRFRRS